MNSDEYVSRCRYHIITFHLSFTFIFQAQKRVDLLQLMLDAESNPAEIHDSMLAAGENDDTHDDTTYSTATGDRKNLQKALTAEVDK